MELGQHPLLWCGKGQQAQGLFAMHVGFTGRKRLVCPWQLLFVSSLLFIIASPKDSFWFHLHCFFFPLFSLLLFLVLNGFVNINAFSKKEGSTYSACSIVMSAISLTALVWADGLWTTFQNMWIRKLSYSCRFIYILCHFNLSAWIICLLLLKFVNQSILL